MKKMAYVAVVDDDESVRESLPDLLREFGYEARGFSSAEEFLEADKVRQAECLVLDIAMPGMSGFDLQRELNRRERKVPTVFITAHGDEAIRLRVRRHGAVDCLLKPFSDTALFEAMKAALKQG
ncbi:MAG: response regulator [Proteobacteria bacterium]|nr:response regulator [Pseudomonadota bacterium]